MRILILGLNYAPEPVGIGPYTTGMAEALAAAGHRVTVLCGKPYYPHWKVPPEFAGGGRRVSEEGGVRVIRFPLYVPARPSGARRLVHHASFALSALPSMLREARRERPDVVLTIAPSLMSASVARLAARAAGAKLWSHVQDFEVEAAFATGLLKKDGLTARLALAFEQAMLRADRVSSISPQMCRRLVEKRVEAERVVEFRNWASIDSVRPLAGPSPYRAEWGVDRPHVALYAGNVANKQGIEIIVDAAHLLRDRRDLMFVVCGNGANRDRLVAAAQGLDNIRFFDLQPMERLSDMLGLATVHLLPQIAAAADLVLPSKLTNMLASGRPVVATAHRGTGLAAEVEGCGLVVPPEDAAAFAAAIAALIDDPARCATLGAAARARAEARWSKDAILTGFRTQLEALGGEGQPAC